MGGLELVLILLAISAVLRIIADRLEIPYSAVLVVGGLLLAFMPNLPRVELAPDVLFLTFVPPLLYWGAVSFPLRDFRRELGPILRLAVLMVLVSTVAVAVVAHSLDPAFTWAAAFTLGAIVSPPDPVAVLSLMRSPALRAPRPIESILEGEGLLNDATALVLYRIAVAAAVTGTFSPWRAGGQFLIAAVGGLVIGLVVGFVTLRVHRLTRSVPVAENTISLLTPYAAYLPADLLGASGVVSVVAAGMYIARNVQEVGGPETRLQNQSMWAVVTFLLESLVFILVGLELPYVTRALTGYSTSLLFREAAIVCACVILVRVAWVVPSTYIGRIIGGWLRQKEISLPSWRWVLFVGWAGVRGGDSLVIALALPLTIASGARFPARAQILFITFFVIFVTLVVQGPTLVPLARWLGFRADASAEDEEAHARLSAAEAGLHVLDTNAFANSPYPEIVRYLRQRHRQRARRWAGREARQGAHPPNEGQHGELVTAPSHGAGALDDRRAAEYRRIRSAMISAERHSLLDLRDRDVIGDDVMRRIHRDLDLELVLLDSREPVTEPTSEISLS
ncbi:MAG TPA: Na+/H+ antiporter [Gemmatimonadaceae bacterium]|jgi:CPA1 family monovalent cation:H+ antiporter|nr:Na+/H+ antiporter [Gemmatimonadaceae bacterium]